MRRQKMLMLALLLAGINMISGSAQTTNNQKPEEGTQEGKQNKKIEISGGVLVESNYSSFVHSGIGGGKSVMKPGVTTGGFLNLGISKHFSIQPELLLHYKESEFDRNNQNGIYRYWGMEIPIYAMYHTKLNNGHRIHIGIGPYTEYGLDASLKREGEKIDLYEKNTESGTPVMRDSNSGFGIINSYEFPFGLLINVSYKISISNLLDANESSAALHPQTFSLGFAYCFRK